MYWHQQLSNWTKKSSLLSIGAGDFHSRHHWSVSDTIGIRPSTIANLFASFLFLVSAVLQVLLSRAQKREKRYGPGPSNNYTSGYGKQRFWQRKNNKNKSKKHDAELGAVGTSALVAEEKHHHNNRNSAFRPSDDTAVASAGNGYGGPNSKYGEPTVPAVAHNSDPYTRSSTGFASSTNYEPQSTGVTGGHYNEMPAGHTGSASNPIVQHENAPYADVHHGGYMHSNPESNAYARNV